MGVKIASMVLAGYLFLVCSALPAIKDQVEYVPAVKTHGDQPIIDTGYFSDWENPFSGSFGGLFDNIESIMDRMRKQIASILQRFPLAKGGNSTGELPDFSSLGGPFPQIGDIDLSKGNTTSVTKVINGHKVIINETEYKNEDANGGTFFKVRIVDVAPDSNEATTEKDVDTPNEAREAIDNSFENEIPKSKEVGRTEDAPEKIRKFA